MFKLIRINSFPIVIRTYLEDKIDWGLVSLHIPEVWKQSQGENIRVGILDSGIDFLHPDLKEGIISKKDFTNSGNEFDYNGHGTHVAGIIGARANNLGIVGIAPKCKFVIGKVLDDNGSGKISWIIKGLEWLLEQKVDIVNLSLGSRFSNKKLLNIIRKLYFNNIPTICAAGNDGNLYDNIDYPARYKETISVGAINSQIKRSKFSSIGKCLDIMAPGEKVYSTYPPSRYAILSGTSMATPFVTGVIALMLAKHRKQGGKTECKTVEQIRQHLTKTSIDMYHAGFDIYTGFGLINPQKLMN